MTSFNFTIRIHRLTNGRYPIEASASDGSHTRLPTDQPDPLTETDFQDMTAYLHDLVAQPQDAKITGRRLYQLLFPQPVRDLFLAQQALAQANRQPLRLRLRLDPPELARLPWEYLYDPYDEQFLALTYPLAPTN